MNFLVKITLFHRREKASSSSAPKEGSQSNQRKTITWTEDVNLPLDFEAWLQATQQIEMGTNRNSLRMDWSHYVLGTSRDMKFENIKKKYRHLMQRYHPDRTEETGEKLTGALVTTAFQFIEKEFKKLEM